ncbi:ADP-ribosylation/Crystallin J1 [Methanocaldococcus lauensis]|nr:ADP-ribosylation/Crystallin J1 [Methanocaldococcus lauensis]
MVENMDKMKDKVFGCVFGAVIGDALGMATEELKKEEIKKIYGIVDDYVEPKNYLAGKCEKGEWTDDTEQAIFIIKSLNKNGVDIKKFAEYLIKWGNKNPPHIGLTSLKAIEKLKNNDFSGIDSPTCGAAMRVYPIAILYYDNLEKLKEEIIKVSKITHNNKEAIAGSLAIAFFISSALKDKKDFNLLEECYNFIKEVDENFAKRLLKIKEFNDIDSLYNYFGTGVLTREVVPSAIGTYLLTDNFKEGMIKCINAGGDTDSLASMYGAISGAYYGFKNIPKKWIDNLKNKEFIFNLAKYLYNLKFG